ncbi:hypothetical protein N752_29055 [Desulforamulus aquiferis]|nr:hypothetical protein N752_29055 [Desulforamulus aquiferis]
MLNTAFNQLKDNISKVMVGKQDVIELLMVSLVLMDMF